MAAGLPEVPSLLAVMKPSSFSVITGEEVAVLNTRNEPPWISNPQVSSIKSADTVMEVSSKVNVLVAPS